ncbi:hypothetical protein KBC59_00950 [Patescibacteria group bacterium]|jgi:hypothetical protein|nr:hypothetical protein [Patescibacteria group bacterium]
MSDLFLDLQSPSRVVDFLVSAAPYASKMDQAAAEKLITAYEDGKGIPMKSMSKSARELAEATWPARYAIHRFFSEEGRETEWKRLTESLRPSTAHLLKRLHSSLGDISIDEALKDSDADMALGDEGRMEVEGVRRHLREDYFREHAKNLAIFVKEGQTLRTGYNDRLERMRELAVGFSESMQGELLSKLARFEDRVWFEGEAVPFEILDKELEYYVEQKELSPVDG